MRAGAWGGSCSFENPAACRPNSPIYECPSHEVECRSVGIHLAGKHRGYRARAAGCRKQRHFVGCGSKSAEQPRRFQLRGDIVSVDAAAGEVTVRHEDIPGLMKGMTMPFAVKNPEVLKNLKAGQRINATLVTQSDTWRLEEITVQDRSNP